METLEHRTAIRGHYSSGREEGKAMLDVAVTSQDYHDLELEAARRMLSGDVGYQYNHHQGFFHTVADLPLCLLQKELEGEVSHV